MRSRMMRCLVGLLPTLGLPKQTEFERVVNERVLRLREEVMRGFRKPGFKLWTSPGFYDNATWITMTDVVNSIENDEQAKAALRPLMKKHLIL